MAGIFKAYDVRGIYPDQLNEAIAQRIGRAFPEVLDPAERHPGAFIVVSHDMRSHSLPLHAALIDGLLEAGVDVLDIGLATTPMNYFAVGHLKAAGGVQVTASHNPAEYNGCKFSLSDARPVSGDLGIPRIETLATGKPLPPAKVRGTVRHGDIREEYGHHLLSFLNADPTGRPLKLVVDAANGMGSIYQPYLEQAGVDLDLMYFELDGTFPNHEANPLKLENLRDLGDRVVEIGADLGVSFDGDADRAAFVDNLGQPVGSDLSTALIAGELLKRQPGSAIVYDLRSSRAVAEFIAEKGGKPIRERVGHSFIKATLRKHDGIFGGELAGHYYFKDCFTADSSLMAVFEMLNILRASGKTMSELVEPLSRYAKSPEINFKVEDKQGMIDGLAKRYADADIDYLDGITIQYADWWFNVRPSNTEPYLRLVLEATTDEALARRRGELLQILGQPV